MRIRRLPSAIEDMDSIWAYLGERDVSAADRVIERLIESTARLVDYPFSGPQRDDIASTARGIVVGSYVILYRVVEDWVEIVRVVHGARDLRSVTSDFS